MEFQDIIEAKSKRDTKNPNIKKYGFKMTKTTDESGELLWINTINQDLGKSLEKGDDVKFVIKENPPWGFDIVSAEKIVGTDTLAKTGIEQKEKQPEAQKTYVATDKDDLIVRQVCLKEARATFEPIPLKDGEGLPPSEKELQEHMVLVKQVMCGYYLIFTGEEWEEEVPF